jgi:hypothetical protein
LRAKGSPSWAVTAVSLAGVDTVTDMTTMMTGIEAAICAVGGEDIICGRFSHHMKPQKELQG